MERIVVVSQGTRAGVTDAPLARASRDRSTLVSFLLLAITWGSSFFFIKVALGGMAPAQLVTVRLVLGATALIAIMTIGRHAWPRERRLWFHLTVIAITFCVIPFMLFAWAGTHLPSGVSSIYNATIPLMTIPLALLLLPQERLSRAQGIGLLIGALGVLVILEPWHLLADTEALAGTGLAQLACLGATFCYGFGITYTRRWVAPYGYPALPLAASQISIAAAIMLLLAPLAARGEVHLSLRIVGSLLALGVLGTGVAYIWNTRVIQRWGAAPASTVAYLTPIMGILLGLLVLDERLAWNEPVGAAVVFAGILIGQNRLPVPPALTKRR